MKFKPSSQFILFFTVFLDMMGFSVIFPIFPKTLDYFIQTGEDSLLKAMLGFANSLSISQEQKGMNPGGEVVVILGGLAAGIYSILQFLFSPVWGRLSDHFGRKPILLASSLGNAFGYLIWLFSGNFTMFVISRVITGAMSGNISVASAAMADFTSREDRAKGMGMIGAGIGLGFVFGPPLGGLLSGIDFQSLGISLQIFTPIYASCALLSLILAVGNFLSILVFYKESLIPKIRETKSTLHPLLDIQSRDIVTIGAYSIIYLLYMYSFAGFEFSLNFFLSEKMQFTPVHIGLIFLYIGLIIISIQGGLIRRLSGRIPEMQITMAGFIILLVGYLFLIQAQKTSILLIALFFISFGAGFINPGLSSLVSLSTSSVDQGRNLGIYRSFGSLGRAIAPVSYSLIYYNQGHEFTFTITLVITFVSVFLLFIFGRIQRN